MTAPYYQDESVTLHLGDCLAVLATMEDCSVDAVVCDPPYGLEFMGRDWDAPWQDSINADAGFAATGFTDGGRRLPRPTFTGSTNPRCRNCGGRQRGRRDGTAIWPTCMCDKPDFPNTRAVEMAAFQEWCEAWARECLRVLKPGGYLLAFGGTRTWHRLACAVEEAGFEIRDSIDWIYGSGFPKSHDVSKAIDAAAGAEREVIGKGTPFGRGSMQNRSRVEAGYRPTEINPDGGEAQITAPATADAARWEGWGTALKPAHEPIVVARKPLAGTVASNVLQHGTGALNIAGCRVGIDPTSEGQNFRRHGKNYASSSTPVEREIFGEDTAERGGYYSDAGRWPPNVLLNEEAAAELDRQSGASVSRIGTPRQSAAPGDGYGMTHTGTEYADSGGASRFFPVFRYAPKAPKSERPKLPDGTAWPTVKPLDLMRWLVRLVTPPGGTVLDCFAGTGTTGEACVIEGFDCILIDKDPVAAELIKARLSKPIQPTLFGDVA